MRPLFACLLVLGLVHASWADDKSDQVKREEAPFNAGDTVRVMWDGQMLTGTVVEQARSGWFKVKLNSYEMELSPVFASDRMQLVKRSSSALSKEKAVSNGKANAESGAAQRTEETRTEETVKISNSDWSVVNNLFWRDVAGWSLKADPAPTPAGAQPLASRPVILQSTVLSQGKEPLGSWNNDVWLLFAPAS